MKNEQTTLVWKALADPTRRQLLDLLRSQPLTTGDLCKEFENLTRYGVMKHLTILHDAGLITIRREGKHRWNHLNAVPIQEIYERWVKPYEAHWASQAIQLKSFVENHERSKDMAGKEQHQATSVQVELEVRINADKTTVWNALINDVGSWWRKDFHAYEHSTIQLEPRAGGRLFETSATGAEGIWYNVIALIPEKVLDMAGHLMPQFGGPATTLLRVSLQEDGDTTVVKISDSIFGRLGDAVLNNVTEGWRLLFEEGLKPYIEGDKSQK